MTLPDKNDRTAWGLIRLSSVMHECAREQAARHRLYLTAGMLVKKGVPRTSAMGSLRHLSTQGILEERREWNQPRSIWFALRKDLHDHFMAEAEKQAQKEQSSAS